MSVITASWSLSHSSKDLQSETLLIPAMDHSSSTLISIRLGGVPEQVNTPIRFVLSSFWNVRLIILQMQFTRAIVT